MKQAYLPWVTLFLLMSSTACAPHWYRGTVAVLEGPGVIVAKSDHNWGDCYSVFGKFPTVYKVSKSQYEIYIAHGDRYWPQLFLRAQSTDGSVLELRGKALELVQFPNGVDITRLRNARGMAPTHELDLRYFSEPTIDLEVLDSQHRVLGRERLTYRLEDVKCFAWDAA